MILETLFELAASSAATPLAPVVSLTPTLTRDTLFDHINETYLDQLGESDEADGARIAQQSQSLLHKFAAQYFPELAKQPEIDTVALSHLVRQQNNPALDKAFFQLADRLNAVADSNRPEMVPNIIAREFPVLAPTPEQPAFDHANWRPRQLLRLAA